MPINPALLVAGVRPPEADAPGTAYARLLQIQQGQTANQLQDEALTQARMQTQQGQQAMYDDSRMRDLYASAISPDGKVDHDKIYSGLASISPKHAEAYRAGQVKLQGELATMQKTQLENQLKRAEQVSNTLASVVDDGTKTAAVQQLVSSGLMSPEEGQQYASIPFADPRLQATLSAAKAKGIAAKDQATIAIQQHEAQVKAEAEARQKAESDARRPGLVAESQAKQSAAAAQSAGAITDPASYDAWFAAQPPEVQQFYKPGYSPEKVAAITRGGMTGSERTTADLTQARDANAARHQRVTEQQGAAQLGLASGRLNLERAKFNAERGNGTELVQAVMEHPELYDGLTPTAKTSIAPELAKAGFTGFGKQLSESAITKLSDTKSAIASLKDLRQVLKDNEQYIGPISGLSALNPYSDARKAQANIDLVKQRVGKALEGGVLRKEDEEKYKRILATLQDTPSTAFSKVDMIVASLERDLDTYVEEQRRAGRKVNTTGSKAGGGRPPLSAFEVK